MTNVERDTAIQMQPDEQSDFPVPTGQLSDSTSKSFASPQATTEVVEPALRHPQVAPSRYDVQGDHPGRVEDHTLSPSGSTPPSETDMNTRINAEGSNRTSYTPQSHHKSESSAAHRFPSLLHPEYESSSYLPTAMAWTNVPMLAPPSLLDTSYPPEFQPRPTSVQTKGYTSQNPFSRSNRHRQRRLSQSTLAPSLRDDISSVDFKFSNPPQSEGSSFRHPSSRPSHTRRGTYDSDRDPRLGAPSRRGTYESRQSNDSGTSGMGLPSAGISAIGSHGPRQQYQQPALVTMPWWESNHYGMYQQIPSTAGWYWPGNGPNPSVRLSPFLPTPRNDGLFGEAGSSDQPSRHWQDRAHAGQLSQAWERVPLTVHVPTTPSTVHQHSDNVPTLPTNAANSATENIGSSFNNIQLSDSPPLSPLAIPVDAANELHDSSVPKTQGSPWGAHGLLGPSGSSVASSVPESGARSVLAPQDDVERQDHSSNGSEDPRQSSIIQRLRRASLGERHLWRLQKSSSTLETFASDGYAGYMSTTADFVKTIPTKLYLVLLLFLPSLYFTRVGRLFEDAELAMPEIEQMAIRTSSQGLNFLDEQAPDGAEVFPMQWVRLQSTWEHFVGSLIREWKTLNLVSALLLSAILTILQIDSAANDYLTRYTALLSLICSLVSLLFGCIFIIRFGTMRKTYIAAEWAMEASQESNTSTWWNVFILLALPAVWLTWSILLYIACIMSFIWRTAPNSQIEPQALSELTIIKIRIGISIVLGLAVVYTCFIVATFRKYGSAMDLKWTNRIDNWRLNKAYNAAYPFYDSPKGSVGSPTAVMTPLRGDSSEPSSPGKPQVHFRDDVSFISSESGSPPARHANSSRIQTRELGHSVSNHGDTHSFVLGSDDGHPTAPAGTLPSQEISLFPHERSFHDTRPSSVKQVETLLSVTRSPQKSPPLLQSVRGSQSPPMEGGPSTASNSASSLKLQSSKEDMPPVHGVDALVASQAQGGESSNPHSKELDPSLLLHVVTHSAESFDI